jgi:hypothetical protein
MENIGLDPSQQPIRLNKAGPELVPRTLIMSRIESKCQWHTVSMETMEKAKISNVHCDYGDQRYMIVLNDEI